MKHVKVAADADEKGIDIGDLTSSMHTWPLLQLRGALQHTSLICNSWCGVTYEAFIDEMSGPTGDLREARRNGHSCG